MPCWQKISRGWAKSGNARAFQRYNVQIEPLVWPKIGAGFNRVFFAQRGSSMSNTQRFNMLLLGVMLSGAVFSPAYSRSWKATPAQIAGEYAAIAHARSNTDFVNIRWWASPTVMSGTPLAGVLEKFIVISVVHFHVQPPTGTMSFDDIETLEARDSSEMPLTFISRNALPPAAAGVLAAFEASFRQSLGRLGDGTKFFIFDAGMVRACEKVGISVPYSGETYTWETPFPGCSR